MKVQITHDVYDISNRIKKIDRNYYIVYETSKNKFEVHNSQQIGSSYCLTIPYDQLDERVLLTVRSTSSTNIEEILNKVENDNKTLESTTKDSAFSTVLDNIEQSLGE